MSAIQTDAQTVESSLSNDEAAEALLARFMKDSPPEEADDDVEPKKKVQKEEDDAEDASEEESDDSGDEDESPESDDEAEEEGEEEKDDRKVIEDDKDTYVKIKVDGEDRTVSIPDLKRLYGQEASLTRKSQEVSKKRKEAEEVGAKYAAGVANLLQRASDRAKPYKNVDWLTVATQLKPEDLSALRAEAEQAFSEEKYLGEELNKFMTDVKKQREASLIEKGREAVKELKRDIPGWNDKVYNDLRHFAISSGLDVDVVDNLVDASAIKLIHKAMLYDRGKAGVVTKKKGNTPKKIIKTSKGSVQTKDVIGSKTDATKALKKLRETGSKDDAAEAFLARWKNASDSE